MSSTQEKHIGLGLMKMFAIFSVVYFELAILVTVLAEKNTDTSIVTLFMTLRRILPKFIEILIVFAIIGAVLSLLSRKWSFRSTIGVVVLGLIACVLFQAGFTLIKANLPQFVPYYADPTFAAWDRALHGGYDPWVLTNSFLGWLPEQATMLLYMKVWGPPAVFLPVVLCVFDSDKERVKRTLVLYVTAWILIGNVFALIGMSAGPVFYDRIVGGDRFADLTLSLLNNGTTDGRIGQIQSALWEIYTGDFDFIGPGISAFPSVHVSVATVLALYLAERSRGLAVVGYSYLVVVLFLSVHTGYHYALDGYFSIFVIVGAWAILRRRSTAASSRFVSEPDYSAA